MKTFLENLEKELKNQHMNDQEIKEIIQDHQEMFEEAIEDGLNPDDLKIKFGEPRALAKALAELKSTEEFEQDQGPSHDDYIFNNEDVSGLAIKLIDEDINIELSNEPHFQVICLDGKKDKYNIRVSNQILEIERKHETGIKFRIFRSSDACNFKLRVPKNHQLDEVKILTKSSDISIKAIKANHIKINNISGDIDISELNTRDLLVKTVSGDVELNKATLTSIDLSIVSGDVEINHSTIENSLNISTVSGDVSVAHSQCKELRYNAVSGDLNGKEFYPDKVSLRSVSGDMNFDNAQKDKPIEVIGKKSLSGEIHI